MIEQPAERPYDDAALKDLVGDMPRLFCASSQPPCEIQPGDSIRCFDRDAPCWKTDRTSR